MASWRWLLRNGLVVQLPASQFRTFSVGDSDEFYPPFGTKTCESSQESPKFRCFDSDWFDLSVRCSCWTRRIWWCPYKSCSFSDTRDILMKLTRWTIHRHVTPAYHTQVSWRSPGISCLWVNVIMFSNFFCWVYYNVSWIKILLDVTKTASSHRLFFYRDT